MFTVRKQTRDCLYGQDKQNLISEKWY